MTKSKTESLERLLQQGAWERARSQIERELQRTPGDHWLLTHLGVTYYEEREYSKALSPLLDSLKIVPDCPLTLWNLAGTLDALGKSEDAHSIYSWLVRSKKTPDDDPCWESEKWTDALKTDCVYRMGVCLQHLERGPSAEHCFREYINLILAGMNGTYPVDEAARRIGEIREKSPQRRAKEIRNAIQSALQDSGLPAGRGRSLKLPKLSLPDLLAK